MTKKDYIKFAEGLREARRTAATFAGKATPEQVIQIVENEIVGIFGRDNRAFDVERFLEAAGRQQ